MNIIFYRFNNIFEADVLLCFQALGLRIKELGDTSGKQGYATYSGDTVKEIADAVLAQPKDAPFLFVFSINFNPSISEVCQKLGVRYVCWSTDSPVTELFSTAITNRCNRVFLFDKAQYERIHPYNPEGTFYLPLATNVARLDQTIRSITPADREKYGADISFVGSLYNEHNPFHKMEGLSEKTLGYVEGLIDAQLQVYGYNFTEMALSDEVAEAIKGAPLELAPANFVAPIDKYVVAHQMIGMQMAEVERQRILAALATRFAVDLYTKSETRQLMAAIDAGKAEGGASTAGMAPAGSGAFATPTADIAAPGLRLCGPAHTFDVMPKVFHLSKINLNITMRPIETGLSLRIFDVMGSGGFLLTNYQAEIEDYFEIGRDLEVFTSLEECVEKCAYYLAHDEERQAIARNGYEKVKALHTIDKRMVNIVSKLM